MGSKLIEIKDLVKTFPIGKGEFTALNKINLTFDKGEFAGLVGPSGSGKTTLLRHLLGTLDPHQVMVGLIDQTHPNLGGVMMWVLNAFNIAYTGEHPAEHHQLLRDFMLNEHESGRRVVIIIDEGQKIPEFCLEILLFRESLLFGRLMDSATAFCTRPFF